MYFVVIMLTLQGYTVLSKTIVSVDDCSPMVRQHEITNPDNRIRYFCEGIPSS